MSWCGGNNWCGSALFIQHAVYIDQEGTIYPDVPVDVAAAPGILDKIAVDPEEARDAMETLAVLTVSFPPATSLVQPFCFEQYSVNLAYVASYKKRHSGQWSKVASPLQRLASRKRTDSTDTL